MTRNRTISTMLLFAAIVALATPSLRAEELEKTKKIGGTTVHYKVVLPTATMRPRRIRRSWRLAAVRRR